MIYPAYTCLICFTTYFTKEVHNILGIVKLFVVSKA